MQCRRLTVSALPQDSYDCNAVGERGKGERG